MYKKIALFFSIIFTANMQNAWSQSEYLFVNLHPHPCGMFAVFSYVAGVLYEYDTHSYEGIEVNFENDGLYYDPAQGANWWNYFCEPIRIGDEKNDQIRRFSVDEFQTYAFFTLRQLNRQQVYELIQKYIKIRADIQQKIDEFIFENFSGSYIISVHYRGTDKIVEAPRVLYQEVYDAINDHIKANQLQRYKIFVASDEEQFIQHIKIAFPESVVVYDAERSINGKALHLEAAHNYQHGEEALIDCILLSKGKILIRTSSNLSLWSTYFNPTIPVIELNQRY